MKIVIEYEILKDEVSTELATSMDKLRPAYGESIEYISDAVFSYIEDRESGKNVDALNSSLFRVISDCDYEFFESDLGKKILSMMHS